MKTMKAQIITLIVGLTLLLCGILGVMNVVLNVSTAEQVLEQNLKETATLASVRIAKELDTAKAIAVNTGCLPQLSGYLPTTEKNTVFQQVITNNGYLGGNLLNTDGVSILDGSDVYKDRDYFLSALKGVAFISGPTVSRITGEYSVLISAPVWKDGKVGTRVSGVLYVKPDIKMYSEIVSTINIGETGGAYIIDKTGMVMAHSDESLVFQFNANEAAKEDPSLAKIAQIEQDMMAGNTGYSTYEKDGAAWVQAYAPIGGTDGWSVGVYAQKNEFLSSVRTAIFLTVCVSAFFLIAGAIIAFLFTKRVLKPVNVAAVNLMKMAKGEDIEALDERKFKGEFKPIAQSFNEVRASLYRLLEDTGMLAEAALEGELSVRADASQHQGGYKDIIEGINKTLDAVIEPVNEAAAVLSELAKGNLSILMEGDYKGDHAVIKDALNSTIDALKSYIGEISHTLGEIAEGDLSVTISSEFKGDFIALKDSINSIAESLNRVMYEINMAADQVAAGTAQVSESSQAISQGATEQAGAIEELTATITQIAEQTRQNAISAGKANEYTTNAKQGAAQGNDQMQGMQRAMEEINDASASISKIIKVIDDIAFQTNILALNAAVEAARAGAHGKGFAVVAEEVRNLAARSANAAKETTVLIEGSIKKTEAGTQIANQTAGALAGIVEGVDNAAELTGQIAQSSQEQATGIAQVNNGIEQLSQVVQTNSATSEETAASAEELSGQAALLKSLVGRFTLKEEAGQEDPAPGDMEAAKEHHPEPAKPRIVLNDNEFGKY